METNDKNNAGYDDRESETNKKKDIGNRDDLDSDVNTSTPNSDGAESMTNDELADTDPNKVADKPSFRNNNT